MAAPFQIYPATIAYAAEILGLETSCYASPWSEQLVDTYLLAAGIPGKGFVALVLKEHAKVIAYALASRREAQLLVERLGVGNQSRRKGVGSLLIVSLIFAAREMKLLAVTCTVDEDNLAGQIFLKYGGLETAFVDKAEAASSSTSIIASDVQPPSVTAKRFGPNHPPRRAEQGHLPIPLRC